MFQYISAKSTIVLTIEAVQMMSIVGAEIHGRMVNPSSPLSTAKAAFTAWLICVKRSGLCMPCGLDEAFLIGASFV